MESAKYAVAAKTVNTRSLTYFGVLATQTMESIKQGISSMFWSLATMDAARRLPATHMYGPNLRPMLKQRMVRKARTEPNA
ncbi:MAG: hypothetical protein QW470_01970 [Candidatus Caldarchaeum sp.]